MGKCTREILNQIYEPFVTKAQELQHKLAKVTEPFKIKSGFYNNHYHKNSYGEYEADINPVFVVSIVDLCDVEIDYDNITITSKLSRAQINQFDWSIVGSALWQRKISRWVYGHYCQSC